jgi:hypothetical protein
MSGGSLLENARRELFAGFGHDRDEDLIRELLESEDFNTDAYSQKSRDFDGYLEVVTSVHKFKLDLETDMNTAQIGLVLPAVAYSDAYRAYCADQVNNNKDEFNKQFLDYIVVAGLFNNI